MLNNGEQQRIVVAPNEIDLYSQALLVALRDFACPPYFDSLLHEPMDQLKGLSLSQLFDGWMVVSHVARWLWENTSTERSISSTEAEGVSDMRQFIPFVKKEALVAALGEAAGIPPTGAGALIDFLTFSKKGKHQLWTQPLVSAGDPSTLYPVMGAVVAPPNTRFMLELWMAQLKVSLGDKGEPFERHLRKVIVEAIDDSPLLSKVAKVIPDDFTFKCSDEQFAQIDTLFCIGSQVFVVEAKCILEPTESSSIGTHRQTVTEGADQAKMRVRLIDEHRQEFINAMKRFGWNLSQDFAVHPLVAVSTVAHVGVACGDVPVVDDLVLERFFAGGYEFVGLDTGDFSVVQRIRHQFYLTESEAEAKAAKYFAHPPQLQQYVQALELREVPMYAVSEMDWHGVMFDFDQIASIGSGG